MYTEEPRREINWGNLIKKGLLILIAAVAIFLIIWLVTRNNSNGVNVNYDDNNTVETNKNPNSNTYSEIFINNYRYFHDTAKEYFLISNLPEKGKTLKFTLQELIDKKLVLPFSYTDKEVCDTEASYVSVKNTNGKYEMTTNLVCGKEVAKTVEELGCNQICVDKICSCKCDDTPEVEKITEYQYKQAYKATEEVYTCPSGYTKTGTGSNTTCIKKDEDTKKIVKIVEYNCIDGYDKVGSGSDAKCVKNIEKTVDKIATTKYTCPEGTKPTTNNKCIKVDTETIEAITTTEYDCPSGYNLNSKNKCVRTVNDVINAISNITYKCPTGYDPYGNSCIKYLYTDFSYGPTYKGCTGGQLITTPCSGSSCVGSKYVYKCTAGVSSVATYDCPNGYDEVGSGSTMKCVNSYTSTKNPTEKITYDCIEGYTLNKNNKCEKEIDSTINATKNTTYKCPTGYDESKTNKNVCISTSDDEIKTYKNISYTCDQYKDYKKVGSGSSAVCVKENTTTVNPTTSKKEVTKYLYKWSKEEKLSGWVRTGKTREVNASSK